MKIVYDKILGSLREGSEDSGGGGGSVAPAWAQYADTQYTDSNRLTIIGNAAPITLPNNAGNTFREAMPTGIDFYNGTTQKITPQTRLENYIWRLNFKADSSTNQNFIVVKIDIGGSVGVILEREIDLARGANVDHGISVTSEFFALDTFISNGGTITIEADDNAEIWDIAYVFTRISTGDLDLPDAPSDGSTYGRLNGSWSQISGGGISNPAFNTLNVPDGTQTSANTWYFINEVCPYDMTLVNFKIGFNFAGGDTVTFGVWSDDKTTLIDSSAGTATINKTIAAATTGATLVGGTAYWFGVKCASGISDFYKNTAFANTDICMSLFNAGVPTNISTASAANVAPKITLLG